MTSPVDAVNDIRDALSINQLAVVVGTGVTAASTGMVPTSTWRGLIEHGIDRCVSSGARDVAWGDRARADANSDYELDLIVAAEKATDGLGGRQSPDYRNWLQDAVGSLEATDSSLLDMIVALANEGALIATTNYDDLLADALGWPVVTWRDPTRLQRVLRGHDRAVVHLHGHWRDPESVVFGASSYADVLRDAGAAMFLKTTVYARTLLFVGFGAGLHDPNFSNLRRWMRNELALSTYKHYRLVREKDLSTLRHDPAERIQVVSYGRDYTDLGPFLGALRSGLSSSGLRGLGLEIGGSLAHSAEPPPAPLRGRAPDPAQVRELLVHAAMFERIITIADASDEQAVALAGSGERLDEYRRFVFLFADELAEVAHMAASHADLDDVAAEHALAWARRLAEISGNPSEDKP